MDEGAKLLRLAKGELQGQVSKVLDLQLELLKVRKRESELTSLLYTEFERLSRQISEMDKPK